MDKRLGVRILRILLASAAIGWGVSSFGIILPWDSIKIALGALGAQEIPDDPMLMYWAKMAASTFTFVGAFYLLLALRPHGQFVMLVFASLMMLCLGAVLLFYGVKFRLSTFPFAGDVSFCLGVGGGILYFQRFADHS